MRARNVGWSALLLGSSSHWTRRSKIISWRLVGIWCSWPLFVELRTAISEHLEGVWVSIALVPWFFSIIFRAWLIRLIIWINLISLSVLIVCRIVLVGRITIRSVLLIYGLVHLTKLTCRVIPGFSCLILILPVLSVWRVKLTHWMD